MKTGMAQRPAMYPETAPIFTNPSSGNTSMSSWRERNQSGKTWKTLRIRAKSQMLPQRSWPRSFAVTGTATL
ncbi:MAG TPA: hypothetical protein PLM53_11450 [Spirochaetota bacterium]|nr:hypothetical protein [Spirochaetota bacterium]HQH97708.1 hypothetical protein [Spirochaetota bacterium]